MATDLKVKITATDKATATIKRINAAMNGMVSPLVSVRNVGGEIARNPAIAGLRNMGSAASTVAKSLGMIAKPMAGLTGLGVVAGLAEVTAEWSRMGQAIGNTTTSLGMSTKGLVTMRGAAQMVGLSSEQADGGLSALRQTLQDARWGRNPALLGLMSRLHMAFRYTKDGAIDAEASLKDVADMMATQKDVGAKHTIAQAFGVESLFPLLVKGRAAIEEYQRSAEKLGAVPSDEAIKRAERFAQSITKVKQAVSGLMNSVGDRLAPGLTDFGNRAADFISSNHDSIAKVGIRAGKFGANALLNPGHAVAGLIIEGAKDLFGSQPNGRQTFSGKIKPLPGSTTLPLGIRSNNPLNMQPGGREAVYPTMEAGISAAMRNLQGKRYFGGGNDTVAGIVNAWTPPNGIGNSPQKTANYAAGVASELGTGHLDGHDPATMARLLSAMIRQENGNGTYDKAAMEQAIQHVVFEFKNAPPGMTATARTASGAQIPVRIATSMPAMSAP